MDWNVVDILLSLLRFELGIDPLDRETLAAFSLEDINAVYRLAYRHSLEHLVADALWKEKEHITGSEIRERVEALHDELIKRYFRRYACRDFVYKQLCEQFEADKISYIPLKGMELKDLWPEEWMRSCSDIDVLVKKEDLDRARASLEQKGYVYKGHTAHDISLLAPMPERVHIELHYGTVEAESLPQAQSVLSDIWSYAEPLYDSTRCRLKPEMLYFYHVAHMAKHFQSGGCGIRFFVDLWLMEQKLELDPEQKNRLLDEGGMRKFAEGCVRLSKVLMENAPSDELTDTLAEYIIGGGIYGSLENMVAVGKQQKRSYVFSRLFVPKSLMAETYPILKKYPFLLPAMYAYRIGMMVASGRMERSKRELTLNRSIPKQKEEEAAYLLKSLGLKK